nr:tyrosine-protein phosphatase [Anaerofustis sp.]
MDISKIHFSGELPLEGTNNVRDLGGYYCDLGKGKITKYHKFIRSSGLSYITKKDIDFLISYGVKDVLDLRSQEEAEAMPNKLKDIEGITYYNIPLSIEDMVADITKEEKNFNMQEGYIKRIESKHIIKGIVEYIADNINGNFLFHCTAGKDRTGLVASILLGLCKVSRSDIKANYEVSHTYM